MLRSLNLTFQCSHQGLHNGGQFRTPEQVADTVTNFIFILSAGHAAANFGQYDQYGYPPNYPAWMHGDPPKNKVCNFTPRCSNESLKPNSDNLQIIAKLDSSVFIVQISHQARFSLHLP